MTDDMIKEETTPAQEAPEMEDVLAEAEVINRNGKEKESKKKLRKLEAEVAEAEKRASEKEAELADLNDRYLRLAAEYENFRRRSAQEQERIYGDAYAAALAALFPVVDNLERAAQFSDGESVAKGVAMILKSVEETLQKLGVTEIEALGQTFDPQLHNAVLHIDDEAYGESEIVEVLQKGYRKGDRILRYAMVKVAN
ncbi:MAG: nucleotide exchange factor GrpE [Ruminococcaceae bacterium]|nr:nucleotide exchange factor GrpE [Oscillospiraceae bacterium]